MNRQRTVALALLAGALAVTVGLGLVEIHVPFARDQGASAYVAMVIARGGVVYKDVFHFNLPGIFFAYRLSFLLPLPFPECSNLMQVIVTALTTLAVWALARRYMAPYAAVMSAFLYGLFTNVLYTDYWDISQKESIACLPMALALYFFHLCLPRDDTGAAAGSADSGEDTDQNGGPLGPSGARLALFAALAGLMSGFSAHFKPPLGIALLMAFFVAYELRSNRKAAIIVVLASGIGFGLSFIPLAAYLVRHDATSPMLDFILRFGGFYGGQSLRGLGGTVYDTAKSLLGWLYGWRFLTALGAAAAWGLARRERGTRFALIAFALFTFQMMVQNKYFTYHFIPALIPASLLAGRGWSLLLSSLPADGGRERLVRRTVIAALLLLLAGNLAGDFKRYYRHMAYNLGMTDRVSFLKPYGRWGMGDINPLAASEVVDYIKERTGPNDAIQVMGHESGIYVASGRLAGARYHFDQPLVTDPAGDEAFAAFRAKMRREFMSDIERSRPAYVLVLEDDSTGVEPMDSVDQLDGFPEMRQFLDRNYVLETKIEDYFVHRRIDHVVE